MNPSGQIPDMTDDATPACQLPGTYKATKENTFFVISIESGLAVAEVSDRLSLRVNAEKYFCERPSVYLGKLNS